MHCLQGDVALDRHRAVPGGRDERRMEAALRGMGGTWGRHAPLRGARVHGLSSRGVASPPRADVESDRAERTRRRTPRYRHVSVRRRNHGSQPASPPPHLDGVRVLALRGLHHARRVGVESDGGHLGGVGLGPRRERCVPMALAHVPGTCLLHGRGRRPELPRAHGEHAPRETVSGCLFAHRGRRPPPLGVQPTLSRIRVRRRILRGSRARPDSRRDYVPVPTAPVRRRLASVHDLPHRYVPPHTDVPHLAHRRSGGHRSSRRHFEVDRVPHRRGPDFLDALGEQATVELPARVAHQDDLTDRMTPGQASPIRQTSLPWTPTPGRTSAAALHETDSHHALQTVPGDRTDVVIAPGLGETYRELADFSRDKQVAFVEARDEDAAITDDLEPVKIPAIVPKRDGHVVTDDSAELRPAFRELVETPLVLLHRHLISRQDASTDLDRSGEHEAYPYGADQAEPDNTREDPCGDIRANFPRQTAHVSLCMPFMEGYRGVASSRNTTT